VRVDREIRESQHKRAFLNETLFTGAHVPWDYQPFFDSARQYVRRHSRNQWDPHLGR
jgi:hypothetical protein